MNNYRTNGNRRFSGDMSDCGCNGSNSGRMGQGNYGRTDRAQGMDCGCEKREVRNETGCGCEKREEKNENSCGCATERMYREAKADGGCRECKEDMPGKALAMAYVPWQSWRNLYEVCEGFCKGTIFKELNLEFEGRRCN